MAFFLSSRYLIGKSIREFRITRRQFVKTMLQWPGERSVADRLYCQAFFPSFVRSLFNFFFFWSVWPVIIKERDKIWIFEYRCTDETQHSSWVNFFTVVYVFISSAKLFPDLKSFFVVLKSTKNFKICL